MSIEKHSLEKHSFSEVDEVLHRILQASQKEELTRQRAALKKIIKELSESENLASFQKALIDRLAVEKNTVLRNEIVWLITRLGKPEDYKPYLETLLQGMKKIGDSPTEDSLKGELTVLIGDTGTIESIPYFADFLLRGEPKESQFRQGMEIALRQLTKSLSREQKVRLINEALPNISDEGLEKLTKETISSLLSGRTEPKIGECKTQEERIKKRRQIKEQRAREKVVLGNALKKII